MSITEAIARAQANDGLITPDEFDPIYDEIIRTAGTQSPNQELLNPENYQALLDGHYGNASTHREDPELRREFFVGLLEHLRNDRLEQMRRTALQMSPDQRAILTNALWGTGSHILENLRAAPPTQINPPAPPSSTPPHTSGTDSSSATLTVGAAAVGICSIPMSVAPRNGVAFGMSAACFAVATPVVMAAALVDVGSWFLDWLFSSSTPSPSTTPTYRDPGPDALRLFFATHLRPGSYTITEQGIQFISPALPESEMSHLPARTRISFPLLRNVLLNSPRSPVENTSSGSETTPRPTNTLPTNASRLSLIAQGGPSYLDPYFVNVGLSLNLNLGGRIQRTQSGSLLRAETFQYFRQLHLSLGYRLYYGALNPSPAHAIEVAAGIGLTRQRLTEYSPTYTISPRLRVATLLGDRTSLAIFPEINSEWFIGNRFIVNFSAGGAYYLPDLQNPGSSNHLGFQITWGLGALLN